MEGYPEDVATAVPHSVHTERALRAEVTASDTGESWDVHTTVHFHGQLPSTFLPARMPAHPDSGPMHATGLPCGGPSPEAPGDEA